MSGVILVPVLVCSLVAASALADEPKTGEISSNPQALSDQELDRRIAWLQTTLENGSGYSKLWQHGWTSGYALGVAIGTAQAATTNSDDTRISAIVTASKGVIGTARLLLTPHPGRLGAQPMLDIPGNGRDARLRRLTAGETQLQRVADRAGKRLRWTRHAGNVALNLIGGAFVLGFGDETDAAVSTGVGVLVGELMIFTSPKRGEANLSAYQQRFAGAPRSKWNIAFVPTRGGAAIRIEF